MRARRRPCWSGPPRVAGISQFPLMMANTLAGWQAMQVIEGQWPDFARSGSDHRESKKSVKRAHRRSARLQNAVPWVGVHGPRRLHISEQGRRVSCRPKSVYALRSPRSGCPPRALRSRRAGASTRTKKPRTRRAGSSSATTDAAGPGVGSPRSPGHVAKVRAAVPSAYPEAPPGPPDDCGHLTIMNRAATRLLLPM